jgi:hypothetical protein
MKNALIALACLFSFSAMASKTVTLCGRTHQTSSFDKPEEMTSDLMLEVKAGAMLPAFSTYYLTNKTEDGETSLESQEIIDTISGGSRYCITGEYYQNANYQDILRPIYVEEMD